jgi:hypothetical protein
MKRQCFGILPQGLNRFDMKPRELYKFSNKRQIWRIIPAGENLIIEERDINTKEVFFNCVNLEKGTIIFRNYQTEEKFWIGVEAVHNDVIYFHKFSKPDMPGHKQIIAVDLNTRKTLWSSSEYSFLLAHENKIYSFINLFEGRKYFILDYRTGEVIDSIRDDEIDVNELRYKSYENEFFKDTLFPELCKPDDELVKIITSHNNKPPAGRIECIRIDNYLLNSYHIEEGKGSFKNLFSIVEIDSEKIIFEEVLNSKTQKLIPENFFVKGNILLMIIEKMVLKVYSLK